MMMYATHFAAINRLMGFLALNWSYEERYCVKRKMYIFKNCDDFISSIPLNLVISFKYYSANTSFSYFENHIANIFLLGRKIIGI